MLDCGVDLVEGARVAAVIARYGDRFLECVFTENELAYCRGHAHQLAARLAHSLGLSARPRGFLKCL